MTHTLTWTGTWTPRSPLSNARAGLGVATVNGQILAIGGFNADEVFDVVEGRQLSGDDSWRALSDMPTGRENFATAVVQGRVYAIGGFHTGVTPVDVVEIYDPETAAWTTGPALPQPRGNAGAATLNGLVYVVGGMLPAGGGNSSGKGTATMIVYDPAENSWRSAAPISEPRQALRLVAADGHLYAIGGVDRGGRSLSTVERYDPGADSWQTMKPMRESRARASVVHTRIGSMRLLVVVGGAVLSRGGTAVDGRRTTEIFDLDTGEWVLLDVLLPKMRGSHGSAIEPDGTILAIGGGTLVDEQFVFLADVDALVLTRRDIS